MRAFSSALRCSSICRSIIDIISELDFWAAKSANLDAIFDQLQADKLRKVLRTLDALKSTYCSAFARLCKEIFTARIEANDNVRFLRPLRPWLPPPRLEPQLSGAPGPTLVPMPRAPGP